MLFLHLYDRLSSMSVTKWLLHHSSTQTTIAMVLFLLFSNLKGSDANGHVQKALNALNVYDNIVKNIDDANITALTALNISSSTHDVSILWYYYFWMINIHFSWYLHETPRYLKEANGIILYLQKWWKEESISFKNINVLYFNTFEWQCISVQGG